MPKKSYRIMAFVWDKRCREYTPETIAVIKDYGDAMIAFVYDNEVMATITAKCEFFRFPERTGIPNEEIISCQTFPQDYDFGKQSVVYVCGMSVPPVMIKRIVLRLIEQGVFDYAKSM